MPATCSVLVVDDDRDNRELLAEYLSFVGFDVVTATNGVDAVALTEQRRPQAVLMDLSMPGLIDGWEATRRIKLHPELAHTVVIAVTAHGFAHERQQAMHAGCHAVFTKPFDLEALVAHLRKIVNRRSTCA